MNVNNGPYELPKTLEVSEVAPVSAAQPQKAASSIAANSAQDRTEVSSAASLAHQTMSIPDVRMEKVIAMQQALSSGTYDVRAANLADKLLHGMLGE